MSKQPTIVLKFGGSVLRSEADLPLAVHEIYRYWRQGFRVLAVVSAFEGETDRLLEQTERYGADLDPHAVASLLATGEAVSAALLAQALKRSGIHSKILSPHQAAIVTKGDALDGEIAEADINALKAALTDSIVIASGFIGVNAAGDATLLGRGGTDLTALYLANELSAQCVLVKDVEGLFEDDPGRSAVRPRRYLRASYRTAIERGGCLVQPKAVEFAERSGFEFSVAALGSGVSTLIGSFEDSFADDISEVERRPLKAALLGCGVVGFGVYERLRAMPEKFEITGVVNLHRDKAIERGVDPALLHDDAIALIDGSCDVVVELIGGRDDAGKFVRHALSSGKHVVSANKALISDNAAALHDLAFDNGVTLRYSAAVGGVVPALEAAQRLAKGSDLRSIRGVLNGTSNFVCGKLERGEELRSAVKAAQEAGFAEADPTLDLDGSDAAQKLILLAREAFFEELPFDLVTRRGLSAASSAEAALARETKRSFRVVAECRREGESLQASVTAATLKPGDPLAGIDGAENLVLFETADGVSHIVRGRGAGRYATAEAVLADIFDIYYETLESGLSGRVPKQTESCRAQGASI